MGQLTVKEQKFFDRVALKIIETPGLTIEQAARKVLDDDKRILNRIVSMREDERSELVKGLSSLTYHAIRKAHAAK